MSAEEQIRRTLALYVQRMDDRDFAAAGALFAPNAKHISKGGERVGPEAVCEYLEEAYTKAPRGWRTLHHLSSPVIDMYDDNTAEVVSDLVVYECFDDLPWGIRQTGRYRDRMVLHEGQWLFAEKRVEGDMFVRESFGRTKTPDPLPAN